MTVTPFGPGLTPGQNFGPNQLQFGPTGIPMDPNMMHLNAQGQAGPGFHPGGPNQQ